jgi:hypothetical protein
MVVTKRRLGLAGLVAVMVVGLGLAVVTKSGPYTKDAHEAQAKSPGARRVAAATTHAERRTQLDRSSWTPAYASNSVGWVGVLPPFLVDADGTDEAAPHHSRAPPS